MALIAVISTIGGLCGSRGVHGLGGFWCISVVFTPFSSCCIF